LQTQQETTFTDQFLVLEVLVTAAT
jgi:hypothetical protein